MVTLQLIGWGVILCTTLFWSFGTSDNDLKLFSLLQFLSSILTYMVIYVVNYLYIIPRYLFRDNRRGYFWGNVIFLTLLLIFSYTIHELDLLHALKPDNMPRIPRGKAHYIFRNIISYIMMVGLVTAVKLAERLQKSEEALREAESARVKAELDNLRSQINPHFLLNTLNNIYALTTIDTEKAQKTIKELSDLLRYILYDNREDMVELRNEAEFLKTYIELMSIRLPRKVVLTTQFNVERGGTTKIAPLIFISLIENAFKHSVSAEGEGFINISLEDRVERGEVVLTIKNSNNAKADHDQSGHGIGLEQVRRRLNMLYPDAHSWEIASNKRIYISTLTLKHNGIKDSSNRR